MAAPMASGAAALLRRS
ncbi:MAG: hypothetical protein FJW31_29230 [Acidobacteria bacterium]|nr:hypothetical protein [Acidobacteriota bacterium]